MSITIKVPALGESVAEATVAKWFVGEGDLIEKDQIVCELETDKVTLEVTSSDAGFVQKILASEGSSVGVNADLVEINTSAPSENSTKKNYGSVEGVVKKPAPESVPPKSTQKSTPTAVTTSVTTVTATSTPLRQTKDDYLTQAQQQTVVANITPAAIPAVTSMVSRDVVDGEEKVKMTRLRQTIARRLKEAQNVAAMLTTFNEVDMSAMMALRKQYQDDFVKEHDVKLGFMSFFVTASTKALKEFPAVNAEISGDSIIFKNNYHIGVAVGTEQGLVVPVLKHADRLSFAGVEKQIGLYGKAARTGKLTPSDMTGGTFTITNGGIYGSLLSTPILNAPQSAILGMHGIKQRAVVMDDGSIQARPMMYVALTYDHRIIDGSDAVRFLVRIKEMVENPERLLLQV